MNYISISFQSKCLHNAYHQDYNLNNLEIIALCFYIRIYRNARVRFPPKLSMGSDWGWGSISTIFIITKTDGSSIIPTKSISISFSPNILYKKILNFILNPTSPPPSNITLNSPIPSHQKKSEISQHLSPFSRKLVLCL